MISAVVLVALSDGQTGSLNSAPRGKPGLQPVLKNAIDSKLDEVICVVRGLALLRPQVAVVNEKLFWLIDYGADRGKSHSLIAGLWTIHPQSVGALFLSEDETTVPKNLIDALIGEFQSSNAWIVAPSVAGEPRKPLLFRRDLFPQLLRLSGDQVGLELIDNYRAKTTLIDWRDEVPILRHNRHRP
jgi:molybdenum cofactor cytidylyltransferase